MSIVMAAISIAERAKLRRHIAATDPIYWKEPGVPAFFYCTGQSLTEPAYPFHPDAIPLEACEGVLIWRSDGEGANWDFYPFDPDQPLSPDFEPYDAATNPNGRAWSLNGDGDLRWDEPYTGYAGGGFYSWFIGLAIQYYESTGRPVLIGNTAWGGRSSFHWYPGANEGDPYGQCAWQIDHHMPDMQARAYELYPELGPAATWDLFAFNQSSTDAGIEAYGYPPEVYVSNWSTYLEYAGETEDDGYGQPVPIRWYDPSKCLLVMMERTKRDENYPWWNGQEMLLRAYGGRMQMISSAKRLIWDTEGVDGETGTLPGSPPYNLHFWGDVCVDFGRDAMRHIIANGCGRARTEINFLRHNTSTKFIRGVYNFSSGTLGGITDPGTGNAGTESTTHVSVSRTDIYGDDVPLDEIETGDILYFISRSNRNDYFSATVDAVTVEADYVGFTVSSYFTPGWVPAVGYVVEVEMDRRVYLTETEDDETTYYSDALAEDPYKRRGLNYPNGSMPNATDAIKAHDEEGHVLHMESHVTGINKMAIDAYLRDAVGKLFLEFSHNAALVFKGALSSIDTLNQTTGENRSDIEFDADAGVTRLNGIPHGSIWCINSGTNIALSGVTSGADMFNVDGLFKGVAVDEAAGSLEAEHAGMYRGYFAITSGTMTANKRVLAGVKVNGDSTILVGVVTSQSGGFIIPMAIEATLYLEPGDVVTVDFLALDGSPATFIQPGNGELAIKWLSGL